MHQHEAQILEVALLSARMCPCLCRGELPEDMAAAYEKQRKGFESLQRLVASLGDSLNRPLPQLQEATTRLTSEGGVTLVSKQVITTASTHVPVAPSNLIGHSLSRISSLTCRRLSYRPHESPCSWIRCIPLLVPGTSSTGCCLSCQRPQHLVASLNTLCASCAALALFVWHL